MALVRKNISNKKQAILMAALVAVFAVTFIVAYVYLFKKPPVSTITEEELIFGKKNTDFLTAPPPRRSGLDALQELNKSSAARGLKKFGNWPLPLEPKGRPDLFGLPVIEEPKK